MRLRLLLFYIHKLLANFVQTSHNALTLFGARFLQAIGIVAQLSVILMSKSIVKTCCRIYC